MLLTNLLKNAFVHNMDGGHIRIVITSHRVMFCNTGVAQPLDAQRIFERFYQGKKKDIDWSSAWSKKYPILTAYLSLDGIEKYSAQIENICKKVKIEFDFSELDTFLVVKDMVYRTYKKHRESF